jgi:hypothetical protein
MGQFSAEKPVAPGSVLSGNQQGGVTAMQPACAAASMATDLTGLGLGTEAQRR